VGEILWLPDMLTSPVRDRSELPAPAKNLDLIAPEEIAAATLQVVTESYGIDLSEIPGAVVRLLGFSRLTEESREQVEVIVEGMLQTGSLLQREGHIMRALR
jgi:hypothetical protein